MEKKHRLLFIGVVLSVVVTIVYATTFFDPRFQPVGSASSYVLSKQGLADGQTKIYRPYFDDATWWGNLESYNVSSAGVMAVTANWGAKDLLDAKTYTTRRILTRREDTGAAVLFATLGDLSSAQQTLLGSQDKLNFLRGDTTNEGGTYRARSTVLGDIVHSTPVFVEYDAANLSLNRVYVGANDGMLHVFNASSGEEEYAYIPSEVIATLPNLADSTYADGHRYFVDGEITVRDVTFSDATTHKVLVSGLGGGGQAYFALDITNTSVTADADLVSKLLWEISDDSSGMADLGFSFSRPLISKVRSGAGVTVWAAIFGNGYGNTVTDSVAGSGSSSLFIVNIETGALIKQIDTGSGDSASPSGLSSPAAVDVNNDGIVDYVYAGDLDGKLWRFDLNDDDKTNWNVAFSGAPFFTAINGDGEIQAITAPPRVLLHPDGGLLVMIGTGRILSDTDVDISVAQVQSLYGLIDRLNGVKPTTSKLVVQDLTETTYTDSSLVRTSTNFSVPSSTKDGWLVDLPGGERIVTPLKIRSGRVLFSSTNPTIADGEIWSNEIRYLTGGAPTTIVYDMNADGVRDTDDNIDGNGDSDTTDPEDRITSLYQGGGIVVSSATVATLSATAGTFFINRISQSEPPPLPDEPGLLGGHFDVDTASFIAGIDSGSTDAHQHQYDDKHDVRGVDYFNFLSENLHEITEDITDGNQKFKLIVVNADRSSGGRLSINQTYDENSSATYVRVTDYDNTVPSSLPVYSLSGTAGSITLAKLSMFFDLQAILDKGLAPTKTGCVKSNILSSLGEWRNAALTIWAVKVNADGSDAFTLTYDGTDPTKVVGITDGLLWESTLFWHWKGPCAHEYTTLDDIRDPDSGDTTTIWDYYTALTKDGDKKDKKKVDKDKKKDKKRKGDDTSPTPDPSDPTPTPAPDCTGDDCITNSPDGLLSDPSRTSWRELLQ